MRGGPGPTAAEPPPAAASLAEEENSGGEEDDELELGLCLGSKKQQPQPPSPAPCRILTARDLQPGGLSPDSSVSSSSPAAGPAEAASKRAKADAAPTSPGTVASGHPQRSAISRGSQNSSFSERQKLRHAASPPLVSC